MTQPPSTFEIERDEAALKEIRRLDSVFGDADINPKCIIQFGTFMANWAADYFRSKLQDQAEVIEGLEKKINAQLLLLDNESHARLNQREKISNLEKQLEESRGVIERMKESLKQCIEGSVIQAEELLSKLDSWRKK